MVLNWGQPLRLSSVICHHTYYWGTGQIVNKKINEVPFIIDAPLPIKTKSDVYHVVGVKDTKVVVNI